MVLIQSSPLPKIVFTSLFVCVYRVFGENAVCYNSDSLYVGNCVPVRKWWNWQTHHLEGVAPKGVGVQIPPSAPILRPWIEQVTASYSISYNNRTMLPVSDTVCPDSSVGNAFLTSRVQARLRPRTRSKTWKAPGTSSLLVTSSKCRKYV